MGPAVALAVLCALGAVPAAAGLRVTVRHVVPLAVDSSGTLGAAPDSLRAPTPDSSRALLAAALRAAAAHMDSAAAGSATRDSVAVRGARRDTMVVRAPVLRPGPAGGDSEGLAAWLAEWGAALGCQEGVTAVRIPHRSAEGRVAVPLLTSLPAVLHAQVDVRASAQATRTYDVTLAVDGAEVRPVAGLRLPVR